MKFKITFKDPDGVYESMRDAARNSVDLIEGMQPDKKEELIELRYESMYELCRQWVKYGEYITVEIDTDHNTIEVIRNT